MYALSAVGTKNRYPKEGAPGIGWTWRIDSREEDCLLLGLEKWVRVKQKCETGKGILSSGSNRHRCQRVCGSACVALKHHR